MLDKITRRMTPEEFYAWQEGMDEKYELVDGFPVPRCPDIKLKLVDLYAGLEFRPAPMLVDGAEH